MRFPASYSALQSHQGPHMPRRRGMFLPGDKARFQERPHADSFSNMNMVVVTRGHKDREVKPWA